MVKWKIRAFLFNSFQRVLLKYLESRHFPERMSRSLVEWRRSDTSPSYHRKPDTVGLLLGLERLAGMDVSQCPDCLLKAPAAPGQGGLPPWLPRKMRAALKMEPDHSVPGKQEPALRGEL